MECVCARGLRAHLSGGRRVLAGGARAADQDEVGLLPAGQRLGTPQDGCLSPFGGRGCDVMLHETCLPSGRAH